MPPQPSTIDPEYPPFVWGMIPLRPVNRELFAQAVAKGSTAKAAYKEVYKDASDATAETEGPSILRLPQVKDRVDYILNQAANHVVMTKAEAMAICVEILRTPIGDVDQNHPLAQEMTITENGDKVVTKVKLPSKLDALDKLAKIMSWYAPEKFEGSLGVGTPEEISKLVEERALDLHGKRDKVERALDKLTPKP